MSKTAIVSGASGNLGKAVVSQLLKDDFNVIGTVFNNKNCGKNEDHPQFEKYKLDLSQEKETEEFITYIVNKYGDIHFSALLVGGFGMNSFVDTQLDEVRTMFKLNFETVYLSAQKIFKQMKKQKNGGKIVLTSAKPAIEKGASKGMTAYSLSKGLIFQLAEHINAEGASHQIKASVIVPSVIDTPVNRDAMPKSDFSKWVTPQQIAEVISFIASDTSAPLQDSIYKIYGGS